jgi:hypothetical protein
MQCIKGAMIVGRHVTSCARMSCFINAQLQSDCNPPFLSVSSGPTTPATQSLTHTTAAHNSTHSPLFSPLRVTFARMPAHQSSHVDPLVICGCVADSSDLSRLSATQTQVQCIPFRSRDHDGLIPTGMRNGSSIRQRQDRDRDARPGRWKSWDFRTRLSKGTSQRA